MAVRRDILKPSPSLQRSLQSDETLRLALIAGISTRFINLPTKQIDAGITLGLSEIGKFAGADRCYIYLRSKDNGQAATYTWCRKGVPPWIHNWRTLPVESFPWWADKLSRFEVVAISRIADLPARARVKREFVRSHNIKSFLAVPVEKAGAVTGFLGLDSVLEEKTWPSSLPYLLKLAGEIFLNALVHKREEDIIQKRNAQIELIHRIQGEIQVSADVESLLTAAAESIGQAFGFYKISVNLYDKNTGEIVYLIGWNKTGLDIPRGHRQKLGEGLIGKSALLRQTIVANDVSKEPDYLSFHLTQTKAELVIPLIIHDRLVGVLDLQDIKTDVFSEDVVAVLQSLSRYIAYVIESRQKEEALQESLEKYRTIIENIQEGYYEVDLAGNFTFCNDSLCRMLGYPREKVLGLNNRQYMEEDSARRIYSVFNQVFRTGDPVKCVELEVITGDGLKHHAEFSVSLMRDPKNQPVGFRGIVRDITERKKSEQALLEANVRLNTLLQAIPDVVYFKDAEGRNLIVNSAFEKLTSLKREDVVGKKDSELLPADLAEYCRKSDNKVMRQGRPLRLEEESSGRNGQKTYFETIKAPIFGQNGKTIGLVGVSRDITERKKAEQALQASEERFRLLAQNAQDIIYRYEFMPEPRFSYVSPSAAVITGYTPEEHYADPNLGFTLVHPDDRHLLQAVFEGRTKAEEPLTLRWRRKDGTIIWTEQRNVLIHDKSGRLVAVEGIARDVTERKLNEEKIKASLQEKEVLLKEIHHRVKNNLQVISSLFNLQAYNSSDPQLLKILREGQNRIRSMALVHEKLYQSRDLSRIDFSEYIRNLSVYLFHSYQVDPGRIQLKQDIEGILLDINTAIPCGLIMNELISNALKHAFPEGRRGEIHLGLKRQDEQKLLLTVRDDGVGLPEDLDIQKTKSLGMQIVTLLAYQLDGTIELSRQAGTEFRISFQELRYPPRL